MKAVAHGAGDKAGEVRDATSKLVSGLLEVGQDCNALVSSLFVHQ
jgi:hypothetical protein